MNDSSFTTGDGLRVQAHAKFELQRAVYLVRARRALLWMMLEGGGIATIDAAREVVELPAEMDPKLFGAAPGELVRAGIIAADGFVKSTRPQSHARPVQRWRLCDRKAAMVWLASHLDEPTPPEHTEAAHPAPDATPDGLPVIPNGVPAKAAAFAFAPDLFTQGGGNGE